MSQDIICHQCLRSLPPWGCDCQPADARAERIKQIRDVNWKLVTQQDKDIRWLLDELEKADNTIAVMREFDAVRQELGEGLSRMIMQIRTMSEAWINRVQTYADAIACHYHSVCQDDSGNHRHTCVRRREAIVRCPYCGTEAEHQIFMGGYKWVCVPCGWYEYDKEYSL